MSRSTEHGAWLPYKCAVAAQLALVACIEIHRIAGHDVQGQGTWPWMPVPVYGTELLVGSDKEAQEGGI